MRNRLKTLTEDAATFVAVNITYDDHVWYCNRCRDGHASDNPARAASGHNQVEHAGLLLVQRANH